MCSNGAANTENKITKETTEIMYAPASTGFMHAIVGSLHPNMPYEFNLKQLNIYSQAHNIFALKAAVFSNKS